MGAVSSSTRHVGEYVRPTYVLAFTGLIGPRAIVASTIARPILAGSVTPAGTLLKSAVPHAFAGSVTPAGSITKSPGRILAGLLLPAASIGRAVTHVSFTGLASPVAAFTKAASRGVAGSITPAGTLGRAFSRVLAAASMACAGVVNFVHQNYIKVYTTAALRQTLALTSRIPRKDIGG